MPGGLWRAAQGIGMLKKIAIYFISFIGIIFALFLSGLAIQHFETDEERVARAEYWEERREREEVAAREDQSAREEVAQKQPAPDEKGDDDRRCESPSRAYSMAQVFVEKRLKSPSTADFPSIFGGEVTTSYVGDCAHHVTAYVDSQNEYGAMVRTHFLAKVQNDYGTTQWVLQDLTTR